MLNRSESKYFATAARMDDALLQLLEKKDFAYITVKEICENAGVNRSTFYLHYETVDDLLAECAERIIKRFTEAMPYDTKEFLEKLENCPIDELYLITPEYLMPYLNYIKENRLVFKVTVEHFSALRMDEAYNSLNRYVFAPIFERFGIPQEKRKYILPFYINGLMAIINEWLKGDCRDSVEHIISVIQACIKRNQ